MLASRGSNVDQQYQLRIDSSCFGAVVAIATLADCLSLNIGPDGSLFNQQYAFQRWPWLKNHRHVEGPFCLVLENVKPLERPVPWLGALGLFDIPDEILVEATP